MNLPTLSQGLKDPKPDVRLNIARIIGMVQETRLFVAVRDQYNSETEAPVKAALAWAGKRLYQARETGFNTIDAIFQYFNINRELQNLESEAEAEMLKRMQSDLDREMIRRQGDAAGKKAGLAAGAALGGMIIGGPVMAGSMAASTISAGADMASSNLGSTREHLSAKRTPPQMPSTADISIWVKRLRNDPNPEKRKQAAVEIGNLSNTAALLPLAISFTSDPNPQVREAAERFGKILYWNALYWQMSQDGTIDEEIAHRVEAMGIAAPGTGSLPSSTGTDSLEKPEPKEEDIGEILRRAQEKKARRKK